ncbi:MAG: PD40 domain-containing protein [Chitinispirillaceae bacterium]|nr:PD40 domain-containing protein [Chitinispirillaceae bacterium]
MNGRRLLAVFGAAALCACRGDVADLQRQCMPVDRFPAISPDYAGIVIPPVIAPLNFAVAEPGTACRAVFSSRRGGTIAVAGRGMSIRIPAGPWHELLEKNRGGLLRIDLYVRDTAGQWLRFRTMEDTIADSPIDRYCTYRFMHFVYNYSADLRIVERDLFSFRESLLLGTKNYAWGCCNCHTPNRSEPGSFVLQSRSRRFGSATLVARGGTISNLDTKLGYPAWHPGGGMIAFTVNRVQQCFHAAGGGFVDFYDNNSDIVIYDVVTKKIVPVPQLNRKETLETWPEWSPDGRHLYFCGAPVLWTDFKKVPPDNFDKVRFGLFRIAYDEIRKAWGPVDTVLSPEKTDLSISQPRLSPDGRFVLFCMHEYGGYPNTQASSDLYLLECATNAVRRPGISSAFSESWHGWSANGRWILFSSKRDNGKFTRLYFSFVDSGGNAHKPFILPQKDPAFYGSCIKYYNFPEFAAAPVPFSEREILGAVKSREKTGVPVPGAPAAAEGASEWQELSPR